MVKIKTLFKKDPNNLALVINEVNPDCEWVFTDATVMPTRKFDGTACMIKNGALYKRYDAKKGKQPPSDAIPCQPAPDEITGHWPHWVKVTKEDWQWNEAFDDLTYNYDGTYELCGPKIQGNPENLDGHRLLRHGNYILTIKDYSFESLRQYLLLHDIEGIVFHHIDGRMCKIRKKDFGIKR